jgi:hypothetical protein
VLVDRLGAQPPDQDEWRDYWQVRVINVRQRPIEVTQVGLRMRSLRTARRSSAERGTTIRRPMRTAGNSPDFTAAYACVLPIPSSCAASGTVYVRRSSACGRSVLLVVMVDVGRQHARRDGVDDSQQPVEGRGRQPGGVLLDAP